MKKIFFIAIIGLFLFSNCTTLQTHSHGLENESFLEFVGKRKDYKGGVSVNIDNKITFVAQVNKDKPAYSKSKIYAISTGKHEITVTYNNNTIMKKQIFVSAQETKKIILP